MFLQAVWVFRGVHVTVTGITIKNSAKFHLILDTCWAAEVHGLTVSSPGNSRNTDGIHLTHSVGVSISKATIACGELSPAPTFIYLFISPS
jgi:polygalacturonase